MSDNRLVCRVEGCGKRGVSIHNRLCNYHWEKQIEINVKNYVENARGLIT